MIIDTNPRASWSTSWGCTVYDRRMVPAHPRTQRSCILPSFLHSTGTDWQGLVANPSKLKHTVTRTPKERSYSLIKDFSMSTNPRDAAVASWTFYSIIMLRNKKQYRWKICIKNAYRSFNTTYFPYTYVHNNVYNEQNKWIHVKNSRFQNKFSRLWPLRAFSGTYAFLLYMCGAYSSSIWILPHLNQVFLLLFQGECTTNQKF